MCVWGVLFQVCVEVVSHADNIYNKTVYKCFVAVLSTTAGHDQES